jgi:hypothetical protein
MNMQQRNGDYSDEVTTELQAIVDLADANVSPLADAEAWQEEIVARQRGEREEPQPLDSEEIQLVIDQSMTLA